MSSIASDQDLRPRTSRNLCIENTPAVAAFTGLVAAAVGTGQWWLGAVALLPASAAGWHSYRTISNERRYRRIRRNVAAAREGRRRAEEIHQAAAALSPTVASDTHDGQQS